MTTIIHDDYDYNDLITMKECSDMTGFTASYLKNIPDFPSPALKERVYHATQYGMASTRRCMYRRSEVMEWMETHPRIRKHKRKRL